MSSASSRTAVSIGTDKTWMTSRVAVITGAGSGIGRAVALALHKSGFSVVLAGRRPEAIDETASLAGAHGTLAIPMEELTYDQWLAVVNVNLTGSFLCAQEAIRMMKSQDPRGGRIINN